MKNILFLLVSTIILSSCSQTFYQVYKVQANVSGQSENNIFFEDQNVIVYYDLWNEGGRANFTVYNKTDSLLTIRLDHSFLIINQDAFCYFQNRIYTYSSGVLKTNQERELQINAANSIAFLEQPSIIIPAHSKKSFDSNKINGEILRDCNLWRYPRKSSQIKSLVFSKETSPTNFTNEIEYCVGGNTSTLRHEFYVNEITNYPELAITKYVYKEFCGVPEQRATMVWKDRSPLKFYLKYTR